MISNVIVTNRDDAGWIVKDLIKSGKNVCWITICNTQAKPLINKSNKHILVCKFADIPTNPSTPNQARKIKNFIMNHHINMIQEFVLVINCHAGISRSAAIGMFCQQNLNLNVKFGKECFPNSGVMKALKVKNTASLTSIDFGQFQWDEEKGIWLLK